MPYIIIYSRRNYISYTACGPGYLSQYSDSLLPGRFGVRTPVGARFFVLVRTGPGAPPAFGTMGTTFSRNLLDPFVDQKWYSDYGVYTIWHRD